ncbi:MAG: hypothetical protein JNG88_12495, partial [Phycisphaerales bacterium]|nr:hypothetical protein [Phycisphaerales bacterium]
TRVCSREGRERPKFTAEAIKMLAEYGWPGNVRELQNLCERVCVLEAGKQVTPPVVAPLLGGPIKAPSPVIETPQYRDGNILDDAERDLIFRTLDRFAGHREKTARALGIGLRTLGLKLKKWREEGTLPDRLIRHAQSALVEVGV